MKGLQASGWQKAWRFCWYALFTTVLRWVFLPPVKLYLLRAAGAGVGEDTVLFNVSFANLYHYGFSPLVIGKRCFIGDEAMLDVRGGIVIEDDVTVSNRAIIVSHINVGFADHPL